MAQSTTIEVKSNFANYVKHYILQNTNQTPTTTTFQFDDSFNITQWNEAKCAAPTMVQLQNYTAVQVENTRMLVFVAKNTMLQSIKLLVNAQSRKSSVLGSLLSAPADLTDQNIVDALDSGAIECSKVTGAMDK